MATMNVSLPPQMKAWVEKQTKDGRYANASDYVRDLIRKDRERLDAMAALRDEVKKGFDSGFDEPFDMDDFLNDARARWAKRPDT